MNMLLVTLFIADSVTHLSCTKGFMFVNTECEK